MLQIMMTMITSILKTSAVRGHLFQNSIVQDAYENEAKNLEERVISLLEEEHAQLYPLITKLVIASCQMTKHCESPHSHSSYLLQCCSHC